MSIDDIELSGSFFRRLAPSEQQVFLQNLATRRRRYEAISSALRGECGLSEECKKKLLIVGDRPGPSRPTDPRFHHTPFYSTFHCSGWLNALQVDEGTPEDELVWINSTNELGCNLPGRILTALEPWGIILLGGHASKWFESTDGNENWRIQFRFDHPQYWKRFRNKDPYPIFREMNELIAGRRDRLW